MLDIEENNDNTMPLISTKRDKINKVYIRREIIASRNIFTASKPSMNKVNEKALNKDLATPSEGDKASDLTQKSKDSIPKRRRKGNFMSFISSYNKLKNNANNFPGLRQTNKVDYRKEYKSEFLNNPITNIETTDYALKKATIGDFKSCCGSETEDKKQILKFQKRMKVNLHKPKRITKLKKSFSTGTNSDGEFKFVKPKFLKSVTSALDADDRVIEVYMGYVVERRSELGRK